MLTVDDDPEVLRAIERDLRSHYAQKYRVMRANSGSAALSTLRELKARNNPVALVIADQRMPQMDGLEAAKAIRECKELCKSVPILAITAFDTYGMEEAALEAGCNGYIRKPLDTEEAERILRSFIPW